jgi:signal transduction histidine kinase
LPDSAHPSSYADDAPAVVLDRGGLDRLFPFHIRVDGAFRVVGMGRALARIVTLSDGPPPLDEAFTIDRPSDVKDFRSLVAAEGQVIIVGSVARPEFKLKGEIFALPQGDHAVLLTVPWIRDPRMVDEFDLTISDFAVGDSTPDHLFLIETQAGLLKDAKAMTERLRIARDEAVAASRAKTEFLANMSHELRTPLNAIIGFSEYLDMLGAQSIPERFLGYIKDIQRAGRGLLTLVDDLLELSRLDLGKAVLSESKFDLVALLQEVVRAVSRQAQSASVTIDFPPIAPAMICADERMMRQIAVNLLTNAIKFNRPGGSVQARIEWPASGGIALVVSDTGIGIAPARIPQLIQPYGETAQVARAQGGSGLGLSIVKRLVDLHDGELHIGSRPGEGTTATVILPPDRLVPPLAAE